jgi:hypothetical protein
MNVLLSYSPIKTKKYRVVLPNNKKIDFGAYGYNDYLIYNQKISEDLADIHKKAYIARHSVNEDFNDVNSPSFWALNLLWNKRTMEGSIKDIKKKYNINIIIKK